MNATKIHQIGLYSHDLDETCVFYRDILGANLLAQFGQHLLFFEFSGTRLLFETTARPGTVYFWVDDIEAAYAELQAKGVSFESEPHLIHKDETGTFGPAGNEEWMVFFKDPSDNILVLATQK